MIEYDILRMTRMEKLNLIEKYKRYISMLELHLDDLPTIKGAPYCMYDGARQPLLGAHIKILNYLITKYNCKSVGATIESISYNLETSPLYIVNIVQALVTLKLINFTANPYLGTLYTINKTNILNLT